MWGDAMRDDKGDWIALILVALIAGIISWGQGCENRRLKQELQDVRESKS